MVTLSLNAQYALVCLTSLCPNCLHASPDIFLYLYLYVDKKLAMTSVDGQLHLEVPPCNVGKRKRGAGARTGRKRSKATDEIVPKRKTAEQLWNLFNSGVPVFLELFCGVARVSEAARGMGYAAISLDIMDGWDVAAPEILDAICRAICVGLVLAVCLSPPCCTWSKARRGNPNGKGWPRPVRSKQNLRGLPYMNFTEKELWL